MSDEKDEFIEIKIPKFLSTEKLRKNPWIISTFVFVVLSLVLIFNSISSEGNSSTISENEAGQKLVGFLSENAQSQVTLKQVSSENGLYKIDIDYQGNTLTLYTTRDGNYLIQDLVPISSISNNNRNTETGLVSASVDDDAVLGNENAPVTIIEFSDYQCPFCRKFWTETLPDLKKNYIDTGKVKLVYRDFPLTNIHAMAQASAEAAECVREKGGDLVYWKMHDKMFSEQNLLDSGSVLGSVTKTVSYTDDDLKKWAKDLGYNIDSCLDSEKYKSEVEKDASDATDAGGSGTPYFVILKSGSDSGTALSGAYPIETFSQIIDGLMSE